VVCVRQSGWALLVAPGCQSPPPRSLSKTHAAIGGFFERFGHREAELGIILLVFFPSVAERIGLARVRARRVLEGCPESDGLFGVFLNVLENPNLFFSTKRSATAGAEPAARLAGSSKVSATSAVRSLRPGSGMIRIVALAGVLLVLPLAVRAAELPVPKLPKAHRAVDHHRRALAVHFGYYFGRFGWRSGDTAESWYGSTFALLAEPAGPGVRLARAQRASAAIHRPRRRPLACLAEPVVVPVGRR
jgi:hypothetical protein